MNTHLKELLAQTIHLLSLEMRLDYNSEEFLEVMQEEIGLNEEEIEEILDMVDGL